jgi:hypothetical protein
MSLSERALRWGSIKAARRLARAVPLFGAALAVLAVAPQIRRKGLVGGTLNTALDAVPVIGAAKNVVEAFRGDFIRDRPSRHSR